MRATEDGNLQYLYIKDKTWTVVGLAEDEAVPEKAMTVEEVNQRYGVGERDKHEKTQGKSQVVVEGLNECFYPIVDTLDAPQCSARRVNSIEGERLAFSYVESPAGHEEPATSAQHETFIYVLSGAVHAEVEAEQKALGAGDIAYIPKGARHRLVVRPPYVRYAVVHSTPYLEHRIDSMTPAEAEQARLNMKPN
jgi:quercetin dioxygenase-like cupin family protein